jgi:hypothetical protein
MIDPMTHTLSPDDVRFREDFQAGRVTPAMFDHRAHIRLAYVHLAGRDADTALQNVRSALQAFLQHHGIPAEKYHETLTRAWVVAVRHFMERTTHAGSSDEFIERNPVMLDSGIMLTHYSAGLLFSPEARAGFVEPDLDPIPRYEG